MTTRSIVLIGGIEIGLLFSADHVRLLVSGTTRLHAIAAVDWALSGSEADRLTEDAEEASKP